MNLAEIIIIALEVILGGILLFYKGHIEESVKTLHKRDQEYEKEKGKYEALQESLQTILRDLEHMKSGVALEEERRHKWIESRNQKLINLIKYSEIINLGKVRLMAALNNVSKYDLNQLQVDINNALLNMRVDQLTLIATNPDIDDKSVTVFADAIFYLGNEVLMRITNATSLLESYEQMLNHALSLQDEKEQAEWMKNALVQKQKLVEMKNNTSYKGNEGMEEKTTQYLVFLRDLFNRGTLLKA